MLLSQKLAGFNFNSYFSKEYSSSLFIFPQKYYKNWNYNIGLIHISIPNIPNTQNLFENDIPQYDQISYFNQINFGLLFNISQQIIDNYYLGINFIPQYSSLSDQKSYGLFYNIGLFYSGFKNLDYGLILNTAPGSFTYWENNSIELFPFTLKNCLIYKIGKVNLFSNINYVMKQKDIFDYSIGLDLFVGKNLKIILGHSSNLKYSTGFLFNIQGVEIQYGLGYQKLESFNMFHHGFDLVFNLNMVNKWKEFLKP